MSDDPHGQRPGWQPPGGEPPDGQPPAWHPAGHEDPGTAPQPPLWGSGARASWSRAWDGRGPLPLRPLGLPELLDAALTLFRARWRTLVLATAAVALPVQLANLLVQGGAVAAFDVERSLDVASPEELLAVAEELLPLVPALVGAAVIGQLLLVLVHGAVAHAGAAGIAGHDRSVGEALGAAGRRGGALVGAWLLAHLLQAAPLLLAGGVLLAGALLQSLPLVILGSVLVALSVPAAVAVVALTAVTIPAVVVEGLGATAGVRRSVDLVRRRFWPVLGTVAVVGLLTGLLNAALGGIPNLIAPLFPSPIAVAVTAAGAAAATLVTLPVVALTALLVHLDLRIRTEGLDLQVRAAQLAEPPPPDAGW